MTESGGILISLSLSPGHIVFHPRFSGKDTCIVGFVAGSPRCTDGEIGIERDGRTA